MTDSDILIVGANGQIGRALQALYPGAQKTDTNELDITDATAVANYDWSKIKVLLNAAAYTNVDGAESSEGRIAAWKVNATAVGNLVKAALKHDLLLVHISTEYVFDGSKNPHLENEALSPLGIYAQSKAAGDVVAAVLPKRYIVRTSWVVGDGKNFVRTMMGLGKKGVNPSVIADDIGRPSFADEVARAIKYLLDTQAAYGTYNISNEGDPVSWADFTRAIFEAAGYRLTVTNTTNAAYYADKPTAAARPHNSVFDLRKIHATGFMPHDWRVDLKAYIEKEQSS
jgi:dTDP-4-dehydrorhamnose reductase